MGFEEFINKTIKNVEKEFIEYGVKVQYVMNDEGENIFVISSNRLSNETITYDADRMFQMYQAGISYDDCLDVLYEELEVNLEEKMDALAWEEELNHFDPGNIHFLLMNRATNEEFIADLPHRIFFDMAIVYYYTMKQDEEGYCGEFINKRDLKYLEVVESDLYKMALKNVDTIKIANSFEEYGNTHPAISACMASEVNTPCGATAMLNQKFLSEFAEHCDDDLYICPVDRSAIFIIPADEFEKNNIPLESVMLTNHVIPLDNRLSNQIFHYDRSLGLFTAVTDFMRSVD